MKPGMHFKLATLIVITFVSIMACFSSPFLKTPSLPWPPTATPKTLHFENELVAFNFLSNMKVYDGSDSAFKYYPEISLGGERVAGLGDSNFFGHELYFRSIRIFHEPMPTGSTLEAIMQEAYRQVEAVYPRHKGASDVSGPITVAGLAGSQETYTIFSGEPAYKLRDIWLQKGLDLFIISIWTEYTNPDDFATFQAGAELFLRSLQIK
jgi:hypothetical protein